MERLTRVQVSDLEAISMENELLRYEVMHLRSRLAEREADADESAASALAEEREKVAAEQRVQDLEAQLEAAKRSAESVEHALDAAVAEAHDERTATEAQLVELRRELARTRRRHRESRIPRSGEGSRAWSDMVWLLERLDASVAGPYFRRRPGFKDLLERYRVVHHRASPERPRSVDRG